MSIIHTNNDKKRQEPEVYSTTGFKDVLASPVFYSVVAITFLLGASSIFGFLQNPLKLKATVEVISQKITTSPLQSSHRRNSYSLSGSNEIKQDVENTLDIENTELYLEEKLDDDFTSLNIDQDLESGIRRLAFNYDITSRQFWTDLDTSTIESAIEESQNQEASLIGIPLESDYQFDSEIIDPSIYTLTASKNLY